MHDYQGWLLNHQAASHKPSWRTAFEEKISSLLK